MAYRILHISDLHLGKSLNGFSLREDQWHALSHILDLIDRYQVKMLLIAGDVFDRSDPPEYALELFDRFLSELVDREVAAVIISGNHDSRRRLSYASALLERCGIHIVTSYLGSVEPIVIPLGKNHDGSKENTIALWPIPFLYPADMRSLNLSGKKITTPHQMYVQICEQIVAHPQFKRSVNILMMHQSVAGEVIPELSDSEHHDRGYLGTVEFVSSDLFSDFDYVALGHIHRPQQVGSPNIRYSGSLCVYSFSEMNYQKTASLIEIDKKPLKSSCSGQEWSSPCDEASPGVSVSDKDKERSYRHTYTARNTSLVLSVSTVPIKQLRPYQALKGKLEEIVDKARTQSEQERSAYMKITLTDDDEPIGAVETLRVWYPYTMLVEYDNARTRALSVSVALETPEALTKDLFELFGQFYEQQNGQPLDDRKTLVVQEALSSCPYDGTDEA